MLEGEHLDHGAAEVAAAEHHPIEPETVGDERVQVGDVGGHVVEAVRCRRRCRRSRGGRGRSRRSPPPPAARSPATRCACSPASRARTAAAHHRRPRARRPGGTRARRSDGPRTGSGRCRGRRVRGHASDPYADPPPSGPVEVAASIVPLLPGGAVPDPSHGRQTGRRCRFAVGTTPEERADSVRATIRGAWPRRSAPVPRGGAGPGPEAGQLGRTTTHEQAAMDLHLSRSGTSASPCSVGSRGRHLVGRRSRLIRWRPGSDQASSSMRAQRASTWRGSVAWAPIETRIT